MAKKKQLELDEYGFSSELDMPDFDFDSPSVKDNRSPATKLASSVLEGAIDTTASPEFIRGLVKKSLPRNYGVVFDRTDEVAGTLKTIYNDSVKEIKPVIRDLKKVTGKLLPSIKPVLPRNVAEKIKKWSQDESGNGSAMLTPEQQRDASLQMQLGDIFKMQSEEGVRRDNEADVKSKISENILHGRHQDQLGALNSLNVSLQQLTNYQSNIESKYQRKSLEIQYRHYFIAMDSLEEQKKQNAFNTNALENIVKNTGLPEYVKLRNSERLKEIMRNKFIDGAHDSIFAGRQNFVKNVGAKFATGIKNKLGGFLENVKTGISGADSMLDAQQMMAESGMNVSGTQMAGNMAGSMATDALGTRIGKWARSKLDRHEKTVDVGNRLAHGANNLPQIATDWSRGERGDNLFGIGGIIRSAKDAILETLHRDTALTVDKAGSMQDPENQTRQVNKSLTEIIPGYLSKIYRELKIIRTGDDTISETVYDYNSNKFSDVKTRDKNIFNSIIKDSNRNATKDSLNKMMKAIGGDSLSPEKQQALSEFMLMDNLRNGTASAKRLSDTGTFDTAGSAEHSEEFAELFKKYFAENTSKKQLDFSKEYSNLGLYIDDSRKTIQDQVNLGNRDVLEQFGFIRPGTDSIDLKRIEQLHLGENPYAMGPHQLDQSNSNNNVNSFSPVMPTNPNIAAPLPAPAITPVAAPAPISQAADPVQQYAMDQSLNLRFDEVVKTIKENNVTTINQTMSETLLRIEQKLIDGINLNGFGNTGNTGGSGNSDTPWYNQTIGGLLGSVGKAGKSIVGSVSRFGSGLLSSGLRTGSKLLGFGSEALGKLGNWALGKYEQVQDVYIAGRDSPALLAWKIKAGHYKDELTGKIITSVADITGSVLDISDPSNIQKVIDSVESARTAFVRIGTSFRRKLITAMGATIKNIKGLGGGLLKAIPNVFKIGRDALNFGLSLVRRPIDVYVTGKPNPVLLAITMRAGGYISKVSGKVIKSLRDIDGPVMDLEGNIVLSLEDLSGGMFDVNGKPLKTISKRIMDFGKDTLNKGLAFGKKIGSKLLSGAGAMFQKAKNFVNFDGTGGGLINANILSGNGGFGKTKTTNKILIQIRDLINNRLPGEPTTFNDSDLKSDSDSMSSLGSSVSKVKSAAKKAWDSVKSALNPKKLFDKAKGMFGPYAKKDGLQVAGIDRLGEVMDRILKKLPDVKKKILGDADGDGVREGSYSDLIKKKLGLKEKMEVIKNTKAANGFGIGAGIKGMWDKYKNKDKDDEEKDNDGSLLDDAGNVADIYDATNGDGNRDNSRNNNRRGRRGPRLGKMARLKNFGKGALKFGGKALGVAGAAYGAYSAYDNVQKGNYGEAALDAGMAVGSTALTVGGVGGLAAVGSTLGAIGTGIVTVLSAPVVLGALAVAAVGVGAYYGYKYLTKKKLEPLSKVRFAQYGFTEADIEHLPVIFGFEDALLKHVVYKKDVPDIDGSKVDVKALLKGFGIEPDNGKAVDNWGQWYINRFKPIYLTHLAALRSVNPKVELSNVDSELTPVEKKKYFDLSKLPSGPYSFLTSPIPALDKLKASGSEVSGITEITSALLDQELKGKKVATTAAGVAAVAAVAVATAPGAKDIPKTMNQKLLNDLKKDSEPGMGETDSNGMLTATGTALQSGRFRSGAIDPLSAIRFKTYGLKTFEADKVVALDKLEAMVGPGITYVKEVATWSGDADKTLLTIGSLFGVEGIRNTRAAAWMSWFTVRFLPTYLNFATAVYKKTGKTNPIDGEKTLKDSVKYEVAMSIYTTNTKRNGRAVSVWDIDSSPWEDYTLETSSKSVDVNMDGLKALAKTAVLVEAKTAADNKKAAEEYAKNPNKPSANNPNGSSASNIARSLATPTMPMGGIKPMSPISTGNVPGMGNAVNMDFAATGGAYTTIPMPSGNKSYESMRATIDAAAKMVGVDPKLMASMAAIESSFNYMAKAGTSSASGLYQFIDSTWKETLTKYGPKYGIPLNTSVFDPRANALMGAEFIKENARSIKSSVGNRALTNTDLYLAHFMGSGGAKQLLRSDPSAIAANIFPAQAKANPSIFTPNGNYNTISQVYAHLNNLVTSKGKKFGLDISGAGSEMVVDPKKVPETTDAGVVPSNKVMTGETAKAPIGSVAQVAPVVPGNTPKVSSAPTTTTTTKSSASIPIADQTPSMSQSSAPAAPANDSNKRRIETGTPTASSEIDSGASQLTSGFRSPKARDAVVQQTYQREAVSGSNKEVTDAVLSGVTVQREQLGVLKSIYEQISSMSISSKEKKSSNDEPIVVKKPVKQEETPRSPISMRKAAY